MVEQRHVPEVRVLCIMTGGTICMIQSPDGLVPARGFLDRCMAPRPEFNDGGSHGPIRVMFRDHDGPEDVKSLRTPRSTHGKTIRRVKVMSTYGMS